MLGGCPALAGGHTAGCPRSELAHARARPGCGTWSVGDELDAARLHVAWCCKLYHEQMDIGAYFLHEHLRTAQSWQEPYVRSLLARQGVGRVNADQCQLRQQDGQGNPIRKPTGFMSNAPEILCSLDVHCEGREGARGEVRAG